MDGCWRGSAGQVSIADRVGGRFVPVAERTRKGRRPMQVRGVIARAISAAAVATIGTTGLVAPVATPATPKVEARTTVVHPGPAVAGTTASLHTSIPTEMVGLSWDGPRDADLEVRTQGADGSWSGWEPAAADDDLGPDATSKEYRGLSTAGPVWVGEGRRDVQVRVVG